MKSRAYVKPPEHVIGKAKGRRNSMQILHNLSPADGSKIRLPRSQIELDDLWRRVRRVYAAGTMSDEAIAEQFAHQGVTVTNLRARRTRDRTRDAASWPQHTEGDVKAATKAILAQQAVIEQGGKADAVMAAARQIAGVLTIHRKDAGEAREGIMEILAEVRRATTKPAQWEAMLKACESDLTSEERATLRMQFRNAMALHSRAGSVHKVADALLKAQVAERKAWGVPEDPKDSNPVDSMNDDQLLAELARLRSDLATLGVPVDGLLGSTVVPFPGGKVA